MRSVLCRSLGAFVLLLAAVPAFATIQTYSSFDAWTAAVSGSPNVITFDSLPAATGLTSISQDSVTFRAFDDSNSLAIVTSMGDTFACKTDKCLTDARPTNSSQTTGITASHSDTPTALAFSIFSGWDVKNINIEITFVSNPTPWSTTVQAQYVWQGPPVFFGVTSTDQIATIRWTAPYDNVPMIIDDYMYGMANAQTPPDPPSTDTPESASLGYIGIGLVALLLGKPWAKDRRR